MALMTRKNRAARADAKRQRQHRDGGEAWSSDEQAGSKTQIGEEVFDESKCAHVATGLLHGIHAPHVASSSPPCIRQVISTRHRKLLHLVEMKLQLVVELLLDGPSAQERTKRDEHAMVDALDHGQSDGIE